MGNENAAEEEHPEDQQKAQDDDKDIDLTPQEHEVALYRAFRSFRSPGLPKADVDTYTQRVTPHTKTLIEQQVRELGSAKVQLSMWVKWKKQVGQAIRLDPEEMQDLGVPENQAPGIHEILVETLKRYYKAFLHASRLRSKTQHYLEVVLHLIASCTWISTFTG